MTTKKPAVTESFARQVWNTFSALNVNEYVEKKGQLTYLSWTHAVDQMMSCYPESDFMIHEPVKYGDGSVEVRVTVCIREGENGIEKTMWLPVMDNRNNAIKDPDARKISDTKMRCLVKCLALFGLGLYIYAGEDIPRAEAESPKQLPNPTPEQWANIVKYAQSKIPSGRSTPESVINMAQSKYTLTEKQIESIVGLASQEAA